MASWTSDSVKKAKDQLAREVKEAKEDYSAYSQAAGDADRNEQQLLKIAGGVNERLNWQVLNAYINEAVPRIDGSNLVQNAHDGGRPFNKYYAENPEAKKAAKRWPELQAKLAEGITLSPEEQKELEEVKKHLVQMHIEAVSALYSDKIQASSVGAVISGRNLGQSVTIPPKGWIVEIRGYTYNSAKDGFVRDTLVENLKDLTETDPKKRQLTNAKLPPEATYVLREKDAPRISAVTLFRADPDNNPKPGRFYFMENSALAPLLEMWGPALPPTPGGKKDIATPGGKVRAIPTTRKNWRPPTFTAAAASFGIQAPGAPPPKTLFGAPTGNPPLAGGAPTAAAPAAPIPLAVRTEFVVVFIWQEPLTVQGSTFGF
jgi:hypothetical protein